MKYVASVIFSFLAILGVSGCVSNTEANHDNGFENTSYSVISEGNQTDIQSQRHEIVSDSESYSALLSSVPSITGEIPSPNFSTNSIVSIFSDFGPCTDIEVSSVEENSETLLVNLVQVYTVDPGLCDPSPEAFSTKPYLLISIKNTSKPVSFKYRRRNDF